MTNQSEGPIFFGTPCSISNAVFSNSYCYPETEIEINVPIEMIIIDADGVKEEELTISGKHHKTSMFCCQENPLCVKECKAGLNRVPHEFRVLKANEDVPYIAHTLGTGNF